MTYKFSGYETFPCRYSWLPKAYEVLEADPSVFKDEANAMLAFGVGKNIAERRFIDDIRFFGGLLFHRIHPGRLPG